MTSHAICMTGYARDVAKCYVTTRPRYVINNGKSAMHVECGYKMNSNVLVAYNLKPL